MGSFRVQIGIGDPAGDRFADVEALVDLAVSEPWKEAETG